MIEQTFNRALLERAFCKLGQLAFGEGKTIEIAVYDGSALMLTFDWRLATRDVDSVFEADKATVRRLATIVADDLKLRPDWINDGVKGYLSVYDQEPSAKRLFGTYPSNDAPGLRVMLASPEYLFAMKCRAMRIGGSGENSDIDDIEKLANELQLKSAEDAFAILAAFYPSHIIEPKTQFGLEEIFERLQTSRLARAKRLNPGT